jgi:hypothetical protein
MKKFVLTVLALALAASPAFAQTGSMGVYADNTGSACNITVPVGVPFSIYIVHKSPGGATGSQFKFVAASIDPSIANFGGSAAPGLLVIGDPSTGVSIAYGGCLTGDIHLWSFTMFSAAGAPNCIYAEIIPDPAALTPGVLSVNCVFAEIPVDPGEGILNPNAGCDCNVANQESTWGKVKALYR